jgi:hypothetical protein
MRNFVLRSSSYEEPEAFRLAQNKGRKGSRHEKNSVAFVYVVDADWSSDVCNRQPET